MSWAIMTRHLIVFYDKKKNKINQSKKVLHSLGLIVIPFLAVVKLALVAAKYA